MIIEENDSKFLNKISEDLKSEFSAFDRLKHLYWKPYYNVLVSKWLIEVYYLITDDYKSIPSFYKCELSFYSKYPDVLWDFRRLYQSGMSGMSEDDRKEFLESEGATQLK